MHNHVPVNYLNNRYILMEQSLDLQIAVLIFLGGTKNLVSEKENGGAEKMTEDEEMESDPSNTPTFGNPNFFDFMTSLSGLSFFKLNQTVV